MPALKSHLPEILLRYRRLAVAVANLTVAAGAFTLACLLRFDFTIPQGYRRAFAIALVASVVVHYAAFYVFKLTRGWWRYAGIGDFLNAVLIVGLSVGMRLAVRLWRQMPLDRDVGPLRRLAIIGAGDTGEALLREVRQSARLPYKVVAFLDDDVKKRGAYIDGVPVVDETYAVARPN